MVDLSKFPIKILNYKCFGSEEPQGFDNIRSINLIIGRNNSGKSSLLELVENAISYKSEINSLSPNNDLPKIIFAKSLSKEEVLKVFGTNISTSDIPGSDDFKSFGAHWCGQKITWQQEAGNIRELIEIDQPLNYNETMPEKYGQKLVDIVQNPFEKLKFKRLYAERDIKKEGEDSNIEISGHGVKLTNVINQFINYDNLPSDIVEVIFLKELNKIMIPDAEYVRISVQKNPTEGNWEIYLQEKGKKRVSLTHSGSGLQTIILVLAFLHLVPYLEKGNSEKPDLSKYLFAFEELENNLHPSLLRRLLLYLRDFSTKNGCHFFLTTHSNVAIDFFTGDKLASITHVTHDGQNARARRVDTYVGHKEIMDDLEFRASDLLQANGIVWVEGPSDRIYFNRWIELFSEGKFQEGRHYQCVFYGGRLLSHLSAEVPDNKLDDLIKILKVNRNAILIMDSDLKISNGDINKTKQRMKAELKKIKGFPWITDGREIENYIPRKSLENFYLKKRLPTFSKRRKLSSYLDNIKSGEGKRFEKNKVQFALNICPHITREEIENTLNLKEMVLKCLNHIEKWNHKT